jgi:hypothetical protein
MKYLIFVCSILFCLNANAQTLKLKPRAKNALGGKVFIASLDSTLTLKQREDLIFNEIETGNVPNFLRKLTKIIDSSRRDLDNEKLFAVYYVLPDYFCIGSDDDYFYIPMTPILAQKVADLTNTSLPTKLIVDQIYKNAVIKLMPQPIAPSKAMTTVPVFSMHNDSVHTQIKPFEKEHLKSKLTSGNKKDIIISNKIISTDYPRVVIYGWHKLDGKAIQPVYFKHVNTWADYSHGIRLVQNDIVLYNNATKTKTTIQKVLADKLKSFYLSDEGVIENAKYPIPDNY